MTSNNGSTGSPANLPQLSQTHLMIGQALGELTSNSHHQLRIAEQQTQLLRHQTHLLQHIDQRLESIPDKVVSKLPATPKPPLSLKDRIYIYMTVAILVATIAGKLSWPEAFGMLSGSVKL